MDMIHEQGRDIPVARDTDVVVVGGGPAGLSAAVASARNGAKTTLVERFGFLGGVATAGLMANLNGFRNQVEPEATQTVRGIAEEIVLKLKDLKGLGKSPYPQKEYPTEPGKMEYSYAIDTEKFKYVTLKMCADSGVDIMLHTWFSMPIVEDGIIRGIIVEDKSGRRALLAKIVIDASGDGDVAARAGAPFWHTREGGEPRLGNSLMYRVRFGAKRPEGYHGMDFGPDMVVWGPGSDPIDGTDADAISRAEVSARLETYRHFAKSQADHPELADAAVAETPVMFGIRQTRFITGEYRITGDDAIAGTRFPDSVAMSSCPIISYYGYRRYLTHEGYEIPYRCLVPKMVENLLVAGRCISSDQRAYESHRAMIPMIAIGQAAGTAAALSAASGIAPRTLDVKLLRKTLLTQGAVIGLNPKPAS
jgi:hypothetical protein